MEEDTRASTHPRKQFPSWPISISGAVWERISALGYRISVKYLMIWDIRVFFFYMLTLWIFLHHSTSILHKKCKFKINISWSSLKFDGSHGWKHSKTTKNPDFHHFLAPPQCFTFFCENCEKSTFSNCDIAETTNRSRFNQKSIRRKLDVKLIAAVHFWVNKCFQWSHSHVSHVRIFQVQFASSFWDFFFSFSSLGIELWSWKINNDLKIY